MRITKLVLAFTFLSFFSFAQTDLKSTDNYVNLITTKWKGNSLTKKPLDRMSVLGGSVTGYYLKARLVLIVTHNGGEFGYLDHLFYIQDDSLLYVAETKVILKEPETEKEYSEYEKYLIFNTDKNGKTNLKKWPLTVDIQNTYYFDNNTVIKYELKNFDKPVAPAENEIEASTKDLIFRFASHQEELR